ncbi:hypothetical protein BH10CHL1_BH10CHL1_45840 [soil metagenome]
MTTTIVLEHPSFDQTGLLTLHLDRQITVKISANEAQKRVSRYVHWELSSQMHAEAPVLLVAAEAFWRVPVHLTFPAFGDVGCIGFIKVDPLTGQLDTSPATIHQLTAKAEEFAGRFSSPTT